MILWFKPTTKSAEETQLLYLGFVKSKSGGEVFVGFAQIYIMEKGVCDDDNRKSRV